MAKYKNRDVTILGEETSNTTVRIAYNNPDMSGQQDIVPANQVWVTDSEKKDLLKDRKDRLDTSTDYPVIGKNDQVTVALTQQEAIEQRNAKLQKEEQQK